MSDTDRDPNLHRGADTGAEAPREESCIPALFATIHFRSPQRPDGYTAEDLAEINGQLNRRSKV
jgi:hypothetical protein